LARAAVNMEAERIKGSNPWCLWWWWHLSPLIKLKCNTLYMPCRIDTSPGTTQSMSSTPSKRIPMLRGLKFIIFLNASSRIRWSDSRWSRLKHLVSYKIPCREWTRYASRTPKTSSPFTCRCYVEFTDFLRSTILSPRPYHSKTTAQPQHNTAKDNWISYCEK
jgi:hypothetical protein